MSFPRLLLDGSIADKTITSINLFYDNDLTPPVARPSQLIRIKYDVRRDPIVRNVASAPAARNLNVPYDYTQTVRTFIGYVDVLTASVVYDEVNSDASDKANMLYISNSVFFDIGISGLLYNYKLFTSGQLGPDNPSNGEELKAANADEGGGYVWEYDQTDPENTTDLWLIRNINIQDNQNNTSRVTFHFEKREAWASMKDLIDDMGE